MFDPIVKELVGARLTEIEQAGLTKRERIIGGPQSAWITLSDGRKVLNLCANNYLGLADHPALVAAAKASLDLWGYGLSSVRFICGTQTPHKTLEQKLAEFLGVDDAILYSSCFDANGGLFETLLGVEDAVISDELNHASIIDGIRLSKAQRLRYLHADMADLEKKLQSSQSARMRLVVTDGVFSMDGDAAKLPAICALAERYRALVMVDDSHAVGFMGTGGRGTHELTGVMGKVDILTGTFGKALGGASGGYTAGNKEIIALLRQRSRPYLFSNTLAPVVVVATLKALELAASDSTLRRQLAQNAARFRAALAAAGFQLKPGSHPIIPIMLGDAVLAQKMAEQLLAEGVYVIAFSYPVVPLGAARIRTQISAAHTPKDLDFAAEKFAKVGRELGRIK